VDFGQEFVPLVFAELRIGQKLEFSRPLDSLDFVQAAGPADGDGIRRPRRREVHPRAHLEDLVRRKETSGSKPVRLERFGQKPPERVELRIA
jgi:hypothetical protein